MFGLGLTEILFLLILGLIVVGPKQLPEVAKTLGRFLTELKRSSNIITDKMKQSIEDQVIHPTPRRPMPPPPPAEPVVAEEKKPEDEKPNV